MQTFQSKKNSDNNDNKNTHNASYLQRAFIFCVLCLIQSSALASSFNVDAYSFNADATLSSTYYGSQSLHTNRQAWLVLNDARGAPQQVSAPGMSQGLLRMLLVRTAALETTVIPNDHLLNSAATDVYFSFTASEKGGIVFAASRVESTVNAGFSCEQDLGQRNSQLQRASLNIMGKNIPIPAFPAPNSRIDGAAYGLTGVVVYLNEQNGSPQQGFQVTALRISMDYRDGSTTANGEFVFAASRGQLECSRSDLGLNGVANPSPATVGALLNYVYTITNPGPDTMSTVLLENLLPVSVSYQVAVATHGGNCSYLLGLVSCAWNAIEPGTSPQVTVRVIPQAQGLISSTATLSSVDVDFNIFNNTVVINTLVEADAGGGADLSLSLDMPANVMAGVPVMASGTVVNLGPDAANNVQVYLNLPMEVVYLQSTEGGGSCALQDPQMYLCEWPSVANNSQAAFIMELVFPSEGTVNLSALANSDAEDPGTQNNQVLLSIQVAPDTTSPELFVSVMSDVRSAAPGEIVNWMIAVDNLGGSSAYEVVIYDEMSEDLILNSVTPSGDGLCIIDYPSLHCSWSEVPAGGAVDVLVETQLVADPLGSEVGHDTWAYAEEICPEGGTACDYQFNVVVVNF